MSAFAAPIRIDSVRTIARTTAAIVVLFRTDTDPSSLLDGLAQQVALTIVADNSAAGHPGLPAVAQRDTLVRLHTRNLGGLAGAYNQALVRLKEQHPNITHVVFLDEDTDCSGLGAFLMSPDVAKRLLAMDTAAVAPAYRDRATGMRGKYISLQRWRLHYLPRVFEGLQPVAFVINSMSVWPMAALQLIGPFNEGLAVDHVDTDHCMRARQRGLAVYVDGSHEFVHAIGQRRRFVFLGRAMQAGGHNPQRRYLIGRNTMWLAKHHGWREPAFALLCLSRLGYETLGILLAETERRNKLWALLRGATMGLFTTLPRCKVATPSFDMSHAGAPRDE